uniref:hypothetical protein n=1 Tax=Parerythrobacter lutipelagi TaxID=1964208 RepID=UPI0010F730BC|nr:hypothetical protein [Parerythrobacter lutipelagi]
MVEERTRITRTPEGETHTETTVYTDSNSSGGAGKWVLLIIMVVAVIGGIIVFDRLGGAEIAKDNAIAGAAADVGDAAQKVGDAAEDVADDVTNNQ